MGKDSAVKFTIPLPFPSVNSLHQIIYSQRKVELKPEVRKFRNDAMVFIPRVSVGASTTFSVDVVFHYPLTYANGKPRRRDAHNGIKVILDLIAQKMGFDDSRVRRGSWNSVDSKDERIEVTLREFD